MNRTYSIIFGLVLGLAIFTTSIPSLSALVPFGGRTTAIVPCLNGVLITAFSGKTYVLLDTPATFRYANFVPAVQIGQSQLGRAGTPAPCLQIVGYTFFGSPIIAPVGFGLVKIFEGTSLRPSTPGSIAI